MKYVKVLPALGLPVLLACSLAACGSSDSYLYRLTIDNTTGGAISKWNLSLTFSEGESASDVGFIVEGSGNLALE